MDLANYVYQGHLAGDEPQEIPDWVNTGIAQLRDVTLVNALVAAVVDCASNEASGIADALTFNASDLIKGNDGFVDNLAAALVAGMVAAPMPRSAKSWRSSRSRSRVWRNPPMSRRLHSC